MRIYKTLIRSKLTYAAKHQTSPDTAKTRQLLETAEMKTLRRILDLSLFDNKEVKTSGKNVKSKRLMTGSNVEERIGTHTWKNE